MAVVGIMVKTHRSNALFLPHEVNICNSFSDELKSLKKGKKNPCLLQEEVCHLLPLWLISIAFHSLFL